MSTEDVKNSVRQTGRYTVRQADRVTERQNDSMADSRAAKEPALVFMSMLKSRCLYVKINAHAFFYTHIL